MKIAVVGPGAVGCLLAALFAKAKEDVFLVDKSKERSEALSKGGVSVEGLGGSWNVPVRACVFGAELRQADLAILCVKAYDTKEAAVSLQRFTGDSTLVMTLQNGIGALEQLEEIFPPERVLGGVTGLGATLLGAGSVRFAGRGETVVGRSDGSMTAGMRPLRESFTRAGLPFRFTRDIKGALWSKLIVNVGINALTALTQLPNGALLKYEGTRRILRAAVTEGVKVAKRKRLRLQFDDPLAKVESVCEATALNRSSMLQDILKKKRTEIDYINGVIVRLGQELGIPTPVNSLLLDLVHGLQEAF